MADTWREFWKGLDRGVAAFKAEVGDTRGRLLSMNNRAAVRDRGVRVSFKGNRLGVWVAHVRDGCGGRARLEAGSGQGLVDVVEQHLVELGVPPPPRMAETQHNGRGVAP